jgi:hypothetical protein
MSSETNHSPLDAFAAKLAALKPSTGALDRDSLLFRAGQASVARRGWVWPTATAFCALAALVAASLPFWTPAPQQIERVVYVRVEPAAPPSTQFAGQAAPADQARTTAEALPAPLSSFRMEQVALRWGIDALPRPAAAPYQEPAREPLLDLATRQRWLETRTP